MCAHLDHLEDEQVAVSEADKQLRITGRRVHPLQESLQGLGRRGGGGGVGGGVGGGGGEEGEEWEEG